MVTLDDAFSAAEQHSVEMGLVEAEADRTATLRGQAWSLLSPKVQANASYTLNQYEVALDPAAFVPPDLQGVIDAGDPIVIQPKHYWQGSVTVQQPVFSGQALPLLFGAYRTVDAAREDAEGHRQELRAGVAKAYYGVVSARQGVELAKSAEQAAEDELGLAQRQVDAGLAPPRAKLQAELRVSEAKREIESAEAMRIDVEESFARLTGLPRDAELAVPEPPSVPATVDDAVAASLEHRPSIVAADARVSAAEYGVTANWMGWAPNVDARLTWVTTQNKGFSDHDSFYVAAIEGTWLLWDGGYRLAKGRESAIQAHEARLAAQGERDRAEQDVRTSWATYQKAQASLDAVAHEQELAEENVRLAKLGFEAGTTTWLEVEEAQLGLEKAQLDAIVERMQRDTAAIDLRVAIGDY